MTLFIVWALFVADLSSVCLISLYQIPTELGNLGNLTWLYLDSNLLTGTIPAELVHLSNLVDLGIDMNVSACVPQPVSLRSFSSSHDLCWLYNEKSLTGSIPSEIALLSKLEIVYLGYNLLTSTIPTDLGQLENLKVLGLSNSVSSCHCGDFFLVCFIADKVTVFPEYNGQNPNRARQVVQCI